MSRTATPTGQPRKKRGCLPWIIGTIVLLLLFAGCAALAGGGEDPAPQQTTPVEDPTPQTVGPPPATETTPAPEAPTSEAAEGTTVTLEVTANGPASISWGELSGGTNTLDVTETWSTDVTAQDGDLYHLTVYPTFMSSTTEVTCNLYVDGELKDTATGTGENGSASCTQPMFG